MRSKRSDGVRFPNGLPSVEIGSPRNFLFGLLVISLSVYVLAFINMDANEIVFRMALYL